MKTTYWVLLLVPILFLAQSNARGQTSQRDSLKGHQSVNVRVEALSSEEESEGITKRITTEQIKTDVELLLRKSGIKVDNSAVNYLYVAVQIMTIGSNNPHSTGLAFHIELTFRQPVTILVNKSIAVAGTWSRRSFAITGPNNFQDVRNTLGDDLTFFINDFLAANPK